MAKMMLADLGFNPEVFRDSVIEGAIQDSQIFDSGIAVQAPAILPPKGNSVHMPYFTDIGGTSEALSDSTPLTVGKVLGKDMTSVISREGKAIGANDLVKWNAGADPLVSLEARYRRFWMNVLDLRIAKSFEGAAAVADAEYVLDISAQTGDAGALNAHNAYEALALRGAGLYDMEFAVMNAKNVTKLSQADLIDSYRDSEGRQVRRFVERNIIVSEHLADDTVIFAERGAIGYADGTPAEVFLEEERSILAGDTIFTSRMNFCTHVMGLSWIGSTSASPSEAALATGTNWEVAVSDVRNVPFVILKTA